MLTLEHMDGRATKQEVIYTLTRTLEDAGSRIEKYQ
jgi:hypothetical protein